MYIYTHTLQGLEGKALTAVCAPVAGSDDG